MAPLSARSLQNIVPEETRNFMGRVFSDPWSIQNPNGIFHMGIAENRLMHDDITRYLNEHISVTQKMLTYGDGPTGSFEMRAALAAFINSNFSPREQVLRDHVTVMSGGASLVDAFCYCVAEEGEGILIARPLYGAFAGDFHDRARVKPVFVSIGEDIEDVTTMKGVQRHEEALIEAEKAGMRIKGLLLCNPHNPLGRCYPADVIEAYLSLCSKYNIHLLSDEVYAKSVFPSKDIPDPLPFTSVLSLEISRFIDPSLVHVLYGMSKDFCCNGLRISAILSLHNPSLHHVLSAISQFAWASSLSDHAWTLMLTDSEFLDSYFCTFTRRMSAAYDFCANILKQHHIPYVPANCGPFIWIDLSGFLSERTLQAERVLSWRMLDCGISLATGEAFKSERPGWYRITFAMSQEDVMFGFERLWKALCVTVSRL